MAEITPENTVSPYAWPEIQSRLIETALSRLSVSFTHLDTLCESHIMLLKHAVPELEGRRLKRSPSDESENSVNLDELEIDMEVDKGRNGSG